MELVKRIQDLTILISVRGILNGTIASKALKLKDLHTLHKCHLIGSSFLTGADKFQQKLVLPGTKQLLMNLLLK